MDAETQATAPKRGRRGNSLRARNRARAHEAPKGSAIEQLPWAQPRNPYPPMQIVSEDELQHIHDASLDVLESIGIDFINEDAKEILKKAGADVDPNSDRVRLDRAMVEEVIKTAPSEFVLHARNPARNLNMGGSWMANCLVGSPVATHDMDKGRRDGNTEDFRNFLKLCQYFNIIHLIGGYPVEPVDRHASIRHLESIRDFAKFTDKVFHAYSLGEERITDGLEMTRIARGITYEQLEREPSLMSIINSSSPLRLDNVMLNGIINMSSRNQVIVITPFTLAGAMAPVTLAGALAQQNAEALAGIVMTQLVRPGAPVIYGGFTSNVDMKSGAPAFGTPEYMKTAIIGGQLARKYGVPYRTSNVNAANTVDAQAAYESVFSLWGVTMGHGNLIKHAAGWMEGGLQASFEKVILDVDLLQMVAEFLKPVTINDDELAVEAMRDVGPAGHFFGTQHTQDRYKTAFYSPIVSDWRNHETWLEAGSPTAMQKANTIYKQALDDYQQPEMDVAIAEELDAFVERRIAEGGAPVDF